MVFPCHYSPGSSVNISTICILSDTEKNGQHGGLEISTIIHTVTLNLISGREWMDRWNWNINLKIQYFIVCSLCLLWHVDCLCIRLILFFTIPYLNIYVLKLSWNEIFLDRPERWRLYLPFYFEISWEP